MNKETLISKKNFHPAAKNTLRTNQRIRIREVMLIGPDGQNLGVVPTPKALELAKRCGLDLVEISPRARPPVCKIIDYGKYRYELAKKEKDTKKTPHKVKELKFRLTTDDHDYLVKMRHAEDFMMRGMKVKLMVVLRGREMMQQEMATGRIRKIMEDLAHVAVADHDPKLVGRNYNLMLTPLPAAKRKRRYTVEDEVLEPEEEAPTETNETAGAVPEEIPADPEHN